MDMTVESIVKLYKQDLPLKEIARRTDVNYQKVRKILITLGLYESEHSAYIRNRQKDGASLEMIAAELGLTIKALNTHMPYSKGMYNAEYPSRNALTIRRHRERNKYEK